MAALPSIGGSLCSTPQSLADAHYYSAVQYNAAKTRNPLKFAGVSQTTGPISAASGPKFTALWGHVEDILLLNEVFPIIDMCLSCEDRARQSCAMMPRWRFLATILRPVFSASRAQHFQTCILNSH